MMSSACGTIAAGIVGTREHVGRYVVGFDDASRARQAPGLPNHVAWCLGHLALTMSRCDERVSGRVPPESEFVAGLVGDARRFAVECVAFGSVPVGEAERYPPLGRCVEVFGSACERLGETFRALPEDRLEETIQWGAVRITIGAAGLRMVFHNGTHTGQIADLRRAFGMRSVFA